MFVFRQSMPVTPRSGRSAMTGNQLYLLTDRRDVGESFSEEPLSLSGHQENLMRDESIQHGASM
jgi:hypothetical protein